MCRRGTRGYDVIDEQNRFPAQKVPVFRRNRKCAGNVFHAIMARQRGLRGCVPFFPEQASSHGRRPCPSRNQPGGKEIGFTTRSAFSPALQAPIGMAYLRREKSIPGTALELPDGSPATVISTPIA